jgi:hypothetical protein
LKCEDDCVNAVPGMKGAEKRKLLRKRTDVGAIILHLTFVLNHITTSHSVEQTVMLLCRYSLGVRRRIFFTFCCARVCHSLPVELLLILLGLLIFTGCHFTAYNSHIYQRVVTMFLMCVVFQLPRKVLVGVEPKSFITDSQKLPWDLVMHQFILFI